MERLDADIKRDCERKFQAGASRVIVVDSTGWGLTSSPHSARKALALAWGGEQVWHRRKVRGENRYDWFLVGTAT